MKIQSSAIQMEATHSLVKQTTTEVTVTDSYESAVVPNSNYSPATTFFSPYEEFNRFGIGRTYRTFAPFQDDLMSNEAAINRLHKRLLSHMIHMMRDFMKGRNFISYRNSDQLVTDSVSEKPYLVYSTWYHRETSNISYSEAEQTTYDTKGLVKTSDGREIPFNLSVTMSREFVQETSIGKTEEQTIVYQDPLVLNLDVPTAAVTDQEFYFDIDCDGQKEKMYSLGSGSGFLALDKNNDGVINDGSELFGAVSGDSFQELAAYDNDGNGWIDENDDIFTRLKVWTKDAQGKDTLLSLKDADVGAIYLGSLATDFDLTDDENNSQAHIQRTGIYLRESTGLAGTVQHIDLAVKN